MYFAERDPECAPQEIREQGLERMQQFFTAPQSSFQLPFVFETISAAIPDDDVMKSYIAGFHEDGQIAARAQLAAYHRGDDIAVGTARRRSTDLDYFEPTYEKRVATGYPVDMSSRQWQSLSTSTPGTIVRRIREAVEAQGSDHPESAIMQAGLRLVCRKKTVPSQLPLVTAPSRLATAHQVFRQSGNFYPRGVQSMSGALARGGYLHEWADWQDMVANANLEQNQMLSRGQRAMLLEDGLALAVKMHRPVSALKLSADAMALQMNGDTFSPRGEPPVRIIRALAIVVHETLAPPKPTTSTAANVLQ